MATASIAPEAQAYYIKIGRRFGSDDTLSSESPYDEIGEEDRVRLLAGKVDLGRCQCPRGVSR